ncbi:MAG: DNA cytosine methyltransferase [Bacillota bacterium]|jgi:DNA (cytosine-5)-methyltransferase 1
MNRIETISLFCGAGGMDYGFKQAGFEIIWANDVDRDAVQTHQKYFDAEMCLGDIREVPSSQIPGANVIIGGFPCQGFSAAGPRLVTDERNFLYLEFVRILEDKQPYAFVAENVKGLLTLGGGSVVTAMIGDFATRGYSVKARLFNVADFGVPQSRERVILVGIRQDLEAEFHFPTATCGQKNRFTLRQALTGMDAPDHDDVCRQPFSSRYMSRNRKRGWNDISYTIPAMAKQVPLHPSSPDMVRLDKDLWRFGEGGLSRRFSWREAAVVQSFPKEFEFHGDLVSKYRQIGNAVPPVFAKVIAESLYQLLAPHVFGVTRDRGHVFGKVSASV